MNKIISIPLITYNSLKVYFKNGTYKIGFFEYDDKLQSENKLRFLNNQRKEEIVKVDDIIDCIIL